MDLPDIDGPWANTVFQMRDRIEQSSVEIDEQLRGAQCVRKKLIDQQQGMLTQYELEQNKLNKELGQIGKSHKTHKSRKSHKSPKSPTLRELKEEKSARSPKLSARSLRLGAKSVKKSSSREPHSPLSPTSQKKSNPRSTNSKTFQSLKSSTSSKSLLRSGQRPHFPELKAVVIRPVEKLFLGTYQFLEQLSTPVHELPLLSPKGSLSEQFRDNVTRVPTIDMFKESPGAQNAAASYMQQTQTGTTKRSQWKKK